MSPTRNQPLEEGDSLVPAKLVAPPESSPAEDETDYPIHINDDAEERAIQAARLARERGERPGQWPPLADVWKEPEDEYRYSVRDLLIVVTLAAVLLAGLRWFHPGLQALVLGILLFVTRVVFDVRNITHPLLSLGWWTMGLVYLLSIIYAAIHA